MGLEGVIAMSDKKMEGMVACESFRSISGLTLSRMVLSADCGLY